MKTETFFDELKTLIDSGATATPDSGIDIEAFHLLRAARKKTQTLSSLLVILFLILLLMGAAIAIVLLRPDIQQRLGFSSDPEMEKQKQNYESTIDQLMADKARLQQSMDSLTQQINIMETSLAEKSQAREEAAQEEERQSWTEPDGTIRHVVYRGETLYSIAEKYYGDGTRWEEILKANKLLKEPTDLAEGMTLRIHSQK